MTKTQLRQAIRNLESKPIRDALLEGSKGDMTEWIATQKESPYYEGFVAFFVNHGIPTESPDVQG